MSAFEVLSFSEQCLCQALANDKFVPAEVGDHGRAKYLSGYLRDIGAQTIVVEREYIDGDYLDDFAAYYVKCFHNYERRCKRLHFFSTAFTHDQILASILKRDGSDERPLKDSYLGFIVARPLPDAIIGRTVLRTYDDDGGRRNYPCTKDYKANFFGIDLAIRSLAFQEQDSVLAACATVSLWCAFHKTADLFGTTTPSPATITRVANQVVQPARPVPSHALSIHQICNSIRQALLEPEIFPVRANVPLVSLVYGHLKMGLPVILVAEVEGIGLHAITLAGYSLVKTPALNSEVAAGETCIPMTGLRINEFYGHDDQVGPFARILVKPSATVGPRVYPVVFEGSWIAAGSGKRLALYPQVVVVPVYHKIRVTFLDVQQWLTRMTEVMQTLLTQETGWNGTFT
ncbi:MAG: hypothetical protein L0Y72_07140 [Gemmataceae bacterium]|nr:hypothetical protein [Gemmataceae bacterium]MCI0738801.1 hypothetical protein [Gemmataceae bacterium]